MSEQPRSGGLDAETLAAYLDGLLPPEDRARVDAEIAADPATYEWVVNILQVRDAAEHVDLGGGAPLAGGRVLPFHRRRGVRLAAVAALAAAALLLAVRAQPEWWPRWTRAGGDPRIETLVAAVGQERYIEGRLTGGFQFGPLRSVTRGPGDLSQQNLALLAAAGALQKAAEADPSAANLHAWGVAQAVLGDLAGAAASLEAATAAGPPNARWQSDLAAVYLERASREGRPEEYARALDAAARAQRLDAGLLEAKFNAALALEALELRGPALAAWQDYLAADPQSAWAREATRRAQQLSEPPSSSAWPSIQQQVLTGAHPDLYAVSRRFGSELARVAEHDLLDGWSRVVLNETVVGPPDTGLRIGAALESSSGDGLTADLFQQIQQACAVVETCVAAARLSRRHLEAMKLVGAERHEQAIPLLEEVWGHAGAPDLPIRAVAGAMLAHSYYATGQVDRALDVAADVDQHPATAGSPRLRGRLAWVRGLVAVSRGQYEQAANHYRQNLAIVERAPDREHREVARLLLAALLRYIGEEREAWRLRIEAGVIAADGESPRALYLRLASLATACQGQDLPLAALRVEDTMVAHAATFHDGALAEALAARARTRGRLGLVADVVHDVAGARRAVARIPDAGLRRRISVQTLEAEVDALSATEPERAAAAAREALDVLQARGDTLRKARLYHALSLLQRRDGATEMADAASREGLIALAQELQSLTGDERVSYFDRAWGLVEDELRAALDARDWNRALAALEFGKARRDRRSGSRFELTEAVLRQSLNPVDAALAMTQFEDHLSLLVVRPGGIESLRVPLTRAGAHALVQAASASAMREGAAAPGLLVGARLLGVLRPALAGTERLTIVAGPPWHDVRFAALRERPSDGPLIDMVQIAVTPRLSDLVARRPVPRAAGAALVVDASAPRYPGFPDLAGARAEAEAVRALYPRVQWLSGEEATPDAALRAMREAAIVHVAAHGLAHPEFPGLSWLLLSGPGAGDQHLLFARDVARADLSNVEVVVLAACRTAAGVSRRGEGVLSLARAFLDAGVRAVVASQDDLPDGAVGPVMESLHRGLRDGLPAPEALRRAQRASLARGDDESVWASLVVVGAAP